MTRTRRTRINSRLGRLTTPVFLIDADRHVIFFNRGCEELSGGRADLEAAGVDEAHYERLAAQLREPHRASLGVAQRVVADLAPDRRLAFA